MKSDEFNRDAYNSIATAYHTKRSDPSRSAWNDFLEVPAIESLLKPVIKGKHVLDLGCGTGILTGKLNEWNGKAQGIDRSEMMLVLAKEHFPDVAFSLGKADTLPYRDESFEIVASSLVMHYIKELVPVFSEVARVLVHNGDFIFSMHHPFQESFKVDRSRCGDKPVLQPYFHNNEYYWEMCGSRFLSFHHTFENIIQSLSLAGFSVRNLVECHPDAEVKYDFDSYEFTSKYPTFVVFHARKH